MQSIVQSVLQSVCVLGSTGSIGTQVLDVIRQFPERFSVYSLAAGRNIDRLARQIVEFKPARVVIQQPEDQGALLTLVEKYRQEQALTRPVSPFVLEAGPEALRQLPALPETDLVVVGLVGLCGLAPTLAALTARKKVLTANKETFVAGGHLVAPYLSQILPIDSEHSAIHQCLQNLGLREKSQSSSIARLYLTASGGPFRMHLPEQLAQVSKTDALRHPNWVMGPKITVDSATMMNKGLEVIEAHWLFGVPYDRIQIVIHPQSLIHSGVEFVDGALLFQMGAADMRGPIQYAMLHPDRLETPFEACRLDFLSISRLDLSPPDPVRFPCIRLAYEAGRLGGSMPCVLNAADEAAVALFLEEKIHFLDIARLVELTMTEHSAAGHTAMPDLEEIHRIDRWARNTVQALAGVSEVVPLLSR